MLAAGPGYERRLDMMLRLGRTATRSAPGPTASPSNGSRPHRTVSTSARCSPGCPKCSEHQAGESNSRPSRWSPTRRGFASRSEQRRRQVRSDRPTPPALQQQLDAQRARAGRRHEPMHAADASRRRRRTRAGRHREDQGPRRRGAGADRADAGDAARRGVATARMGSRPRRHRLGVAAGEPGVNVNQLNDGKQLDPLSGTAVLNGIPVDIAPADWRLGQLPDHRHREADALLARLQWHGLHGGRGIGVGGGIGGVVPADSEIEMTLPRVSPASWAYCSARSLASSNARVRASLTSWESSSIE